MAGAIDTASSLAIGSYAALWDAAQGWSDGSILRMWWREVVGDVLDEEALALIMC